jgi:nucleoside-diphosphate-sugar epimerase
MRIFVTGGTGFVGRAVCRQLARRHDLLLLTRLTSATVPGTALVGDLFDQATFTAAMRRFAPERCVHLAWQGLPDYSAGNSRRNLDAGLALFAALRDTPCSRVVGIGSCWEYGDLQGTVSESMAPSRPGMFAACKTALCGIGGTLLADAGISLAWLRPFFIYGPGQRTTSLIPSCIEAAATGLSPTLRTPDAVNDFVHVDDVAAATAAVVEAEQSTGVYNVGSGTPSRVADVANLVCRLMGRPAPFPEGTGGEGCWADIARLRCDTKWAPRISLDEGVAAIVRKRETAG